MVTVVFVDIVGSTDLGERLDPEALEGVLTEYFGRMRAALEHHGGLLEKYIGDAVMGVFGVPQLHEDDALRAVRAATEMHAALHELNRELVDRYGIAVQARTGVNTGEVLQGDIATGQRYALGDAVNVAARLEQAAGPDEILIGKTTFDLTRHAVRAEQVEPLALKGKRAPVPAYRLLSMSGADPGTGRVVSTLIGRSAELAALRTSFIQAANHRQCERLTIIGTAGVGKSRLVHEFVAGLSGAATVVRGRCLPYGQQITYWPFREMVRDAVGAVEADPAEVVRDKLVRFLAPEDHGPVVAHLGQLLTGSAPGSSPETLSWVVRRFLEVLARNHPAVVVLDDLQWADPAMLNVLDEIHASSSSIPLLLLCVFRTEIGNRLAPREADRPGITLALKPLAESEAHQLVANILGGGPFPDEVPGRVVEAAEGNPLFVEQLLNMLIDEGKLELASGSWRLAGGLDRLDAPPSIRALLATRLDLLGDDERRIVGPAAVVGRIFHREAVAALVDEPLRARLDGLLDGLMGKDLIREDPQAPHQQLYRFRHPLIRETAYDAMPKRLRAELHEGFAGWLAAATGDRVDEYDDIVGYHLEQAYRYRGELGAIPDDGGTLGRAMAAWRGRAARRSTVAGDARVPPHAPDAAQAAQKASGRGPRGGV
jgi:class 3 adenylate cyclase